MARLLPLALLLGLAVSGLFATLPSACRIVADIPGGDPYVDASPSGWDGSRPVSALCKEYCDEVRNNCGGELYSTDNICQAVCTLLPEGSPGDKSGNSVECRLQAAKSAESSDCQMASPISDKDGTCGERCQNYCHLLEALCLETFKEEFLDREACETSCRSLANLDTYSVTPPDEGDTLQCRFYHLTAAAENAEHHCPHAVGKGVCLP